MCEIYLDLEWTIIMHLYHAPLSCTCLETGSGGKYMSSMHLNSEWRNAFTVVHFLASQVGYAPVVKTSNVLNIRKVEK